MATVQTFVKVPSGAILAASAKTRGRHMTICAHNFACEVLSHAIVHLDGKERVRTHADAGSVSLAYSTEDILTMLCGYMAWDMARSQTAE